MTFFHQLILQKGIFETAACLTLYLCQQEMLFQQTLFFTLEITPYCANTIEKHGEEIPWQDKDLRSLQKLRKLLAICKINKLVLSKKYMSLKTRSSQKFP